VTVSWTGTPKAVTANGFGKLDFLGCTGAGGWTNGDTRAVCADTYNCTPSGSTTEEWDANFNSVLGGRLRMKASDNAGTTLFNVLYIDVRYAYSYPVPKEYLRLFYNYMGGQFGNSQKYGIAAQGKTFAQLTSANGQLGNNMFTSITTSDGITVSWVKGAGTWGC
jgi:hypothetical protein